MDDGFLIEGLEPLMRQLKDLPARMQKNVLRTVIFRAAQMARDVAKRNLETNGDVRTGKLKNSIVARRSRGTPTEVAAIAEVGEFYGRFVERGFLHKQAGHIPARPFLVPALEEVQKDVEKLIVDAMQAELEKAFKKLG